MRANRKTLYIRVRAILHPSSYPRKAYVAMTQPSKPQAAGIAISKMTYPAQTVEQFMGEGGGRAVSFDWGSNRRAF
jgi:hypothetical protein